MQHKLNPSEYKDFVELTNSLKRRIDSLNPEQLTLALKFLVNRTHGGGDKIAFLKYSEGNETRFIRIMEDAIEVVEELTAVKTQDGFWIKFWFSPGQSSEKQTTYKFLLYSDGFNKAHPDFLEETTKDWAHYEMNGWKHNKYQYGYTLDTIPTNADLEKLITSLQLKEKYLNLDKVQLLKQVALNNEEKQT